MYGVLRWSVSSMSVSKEKEKREMSEAVDTFSSDVHDAETVYYIHH